MMHAALRGRARRYCVWLAASLLIPIVAPGQNASVESAATSVSGTASEYVIGPGATVQVFVWQNPELTVTVPIS